MQILRQGHYTETGRPNKLHQLVNFYREKLSDAEGVLSAAGPQHLMPQSVGFLQGHCRLHLDKNKTKIFPYFQHILFLCHLPFLAGIIIFSTLHLGLGVPDSVYARLDIISDTCHPVSCCLIDRYPGNISFTFIYLFIERESKRTYIDRVPYFH